VSLITRACAEQLGLKSGDAVTAIIKSAEVQRGYGYICADDLCEMKKAHPTTGAASSRVT